MLQDDKLKALVQKLGPNDWKHIASYIPVSMINYSVVVMSTEILLSVLKHLTCFVLFRITLNTSVSTAGLRSWTQNWLRVLGPKRRMRR